MTVQHSLRRQGNWDTADTSALAERVELLLESAGTGHGDFNRREMLTYAWAGTLALLTLGSGLAAYQFLYPRRPVNEFGGMFHLGTAVDLPPVGSAPQANVEGRFWLINNEEGPRAFFEICTHPWRGTPHRFKWDPKGGRFECPVCGSKFNRDGHYLTGPAPRYLDQFVVEIEVGQSVVARTEVSGDEIVAPALTGPAAKVFVDTGELLRGRSACDDGNGQTCILTARD